MIFLHTDRLYRPDRWYKRFEHLLRERRLQYRKINLIKVADPVRTLCPGDGDALIGRFGHKPCDRERIRPVYAQLAAQFGGRLFPNVQSYSYYDDKRQQLDLFQQRGYPTPRSAYVASPDDVARFLDETGLRFPLVTKRTFGAGSSQVALARCPADVLLPGIVQEYCEGNRGDLRVNVIGHRVMGFYRQNRAGDFRASGSGRIEYADELDFDCVKTAYRISCENGFDSMAYDFIRDNHGRWVVVEMSYAYADFAVRDCGYWYDMVQGGRKPKPGVYPQDYILEDFLQRHPLVAARAEKRKSRWPRFLKSVARPDPSMRTFHKRTTGGNSSTVAREQTQGRGGAA